MQKENDKAFTIELFFDVSGDSDYYYNDNYIATVSEKSCIELECKNSGIIKIVNSDRELLIKVDSSFDKENIIIQYNKNKLDYDFSDEPNGSKNDNKSMLPIFIILLLIILGCIFVIYKANNKKKDIDGNYTASNTDIDYQTTKNKGYGSITYKYYHRNMNVTFKNGMYQVNYDVYGCILTNAGCTEDTKVDSVSGSGVYTIKKDTLYLETASGNKRTCKISVGDKTTIDCTSSGGWLYTKK